MGALIALQTLYVEPTSAFSIQYSVDMLFMVLVASRGLWGLASERLGWSLLPVGYRVRPPAPPGPVSGRPGPKPTG